MPKFISVNDLSKYGFDKEIEAVDYPNWHGYSVGIAICLSETETGKIIRNYLSDTICEKTGLGKDELAEKILNDENIKLFERHTTHISDNDRKLTPVTIYYAPYVLKNHSSEIPTVTDMTVSDACNVTYDLTIEILLVNKDDGDFKRYVTIKQKTRNMSVMEVVTSVFESDELEEIFPYNDSSEENYNDEYDDGYLVTFYNPAGEAYTEAYHFESDVYNTINSIRLIGIERHIDE